MGDENKSRSFANTQKPEQLQYSSCNIGARENADNAFCSQRLFLQLLYWNYSGFVCLSQNNVIFIFLQIL